MAGGHKTRIEGSHVRFFSSMKGVCPCCHMQPLTWIKHPWKSGSCGLRHHFLLGLCAKGYTFVHMNIWGKRRLQGVFGASVHNWMDWALVTRNGPSKIVGSPCGWWKGSFTTIYRRWLLLVSDHSYCFLLRIIGWPLIMIAYISSLLLIMFHFCWLLLLHWYCWSLTTNWSYELAINDLILNHWQA